MLLGYTNNKELDLNLNALRTHAAVFGSTGSGKTGLLLGMAEELYDYDVPTVLIDIKGDLCNFALTDPRKFVRLLTPGSTHGEAVNVLADLHDEVRRDQAISGLLAMVGEDPDPLTSTAHVFLREVFEDWHCSTLDGLVKLCQSPRFDELGALHLDEAFPKRARNTLVRKLNTLFNSPSFKLWTLGTNLDIDEIVNFKGVTVYSVSHLASAEEQLFAISHFLTELLQWTRAQQGSDELRLAVIIDECVGLLPPHPANPPTKTPIMLLLKQARAFGVGLVLATQNPVDIDYKAMSNCNTWLVGRMTAERDRKRVVSGMVSAGVGDEDYFHKAIAGLDKREFLLSSAGGLGATFTTRNVECELRGPIVPTELEIMYDEDYFCFPTKADARTAYCARKGFSPPREDDTLPIETAKDIFDPELYDEEIWELIEDDEAEEFVPVEDNTPNVAEALIGLALLATIGWGFFVAFNYFAEVLKGVL